MELLWMPARHTPQAVLEANLRPHSDYERAQLGALDAAIVEVYCNRGPADAAKDFGDRAVIASHSRSGSSAIEPSTTLCRASRHRIGRHPSCDGRRHYPVTSVSPGDCQYVVIAAGGHGGLRSRNGDAVVASALPRSGN